MIPHMREFTVTKNDAGQRLDRFAAKAVPSMPAALLQKYFRRKEIKLNGHWARPDQRLAEGDTVRLSCRRNFSPPGRGGRPRAGWRR